MPTTTKPTSGALRTEATRYLYAGVGVADLAVGVVRDYVTEAQSRAAGVSKSVADVKPAEVRDQVAAAVKSFPAKVQTLLDENVSSAGDTYDELAQRGHDLVGRIRRQQSTQEAAGSVKTTVVKAKTTRTQATKAAASSRTAAKKAASDTATAAKKATSTRSPSTKGATTTARKRTKTAQSSAKATATAATQAVADVAEAVTDAAQKIGD